MPVNDGAPSVKVGGAAVGAGGAVVEVGSPAAEAGPAAVRAGAALLAVGGGALIGGRTLLGGGEAALWVAALVIGLGLGALAAGALLVVRPMTRLRAPVTIVVGGALVLAGIDVAGLRSAVALAAGGVVASIGTAIGLRAAFFSGGERRRDAGRLVVINSAAVLLASAGAALFRLGPSEAWMAQVVVNAAGAMSQAPDDELGWAPQGDGFVGVHLEPIRDEPHVLFLGDSIVQGTGVAPEEATPALMDRRLDGVQVLNAGVAGYSIEQYLLYGRRLLPSLDADLVIVGVFTGNDYEVSGMEWSWGRSKPMFEAVDGVLREEESRM